MKHSLKSAALPPAVRMGRYVGYLDPSCATALDGLVALLGDVSHSPPDRVLSEGRHRTVRAALEQAGGPPREMVIKAFGRQSPVKDLVDGYRGSKAFRTWRVAAYLQARGVGTPRPLGYLTRRCGVVLRESYYLSCFEENLASFKDALTYLFRHDPRCDKFMALLREVARGVAALHDAGVLHNDLGNQNILLRCAGEGRWRDPLFIDLNRARIRDGLSVRERARDLSRIWLPSDLLRIFKEMYYHDRGVPAAFHRWEDVYRRRYAVHTATRRLRHPLRDVKKGRDERDAPATDYPSPRDLWIWDERSAQAIVTLVSRDRRRHYSRRWVWQPVWDTARALPSVGRQYRHLLAASYRQPVDLRHRIALAVEPRAPSWERERELLEELGSLPVLVRMYHHEDAAARAFRAEVVRQLAAAGRPVAIALVQDRVAVRDPARWRAFVESVLSRVADCVDWVETGHAVNRVKWGVWTFEEQRRLLREVADVARAWPALRLMGPAAIDFEYPFVVAALKNRPGTMRYGALSHHLYVDRRGAPENRQGPFDALRKFALARAIARWAPACEDRLIVSEVNWPIAGTGIDSPVGSPYASPGPRHNDPSVSEEEYAAYMLRYLAIALCSGLVERVYWWRLVARGFGLVDDTVPDAWRTRPAYHALKVLLRRTAGCTFRARRTQWPGAAHPAVHILAFDAPAASEWSLAWSSDGARTVELPREAACVADMQGRIVEVNAARVTLTGCPVYLGPADSEGIGQGSAR